MAEIIDAVAVLNKPKPLDQVRNIIRRRHWSARPAANVRAARAFRYGRGAGVGHGRGVAACLGVGVGLAVAVGVGVAVEVDVGVGLGVTVGVGVPPPGGIGALIQGITSLFTSSQY